MHYYVQFLYFGDEMHKSGLYIRDRKGRHYLQISLLQKDIKQNESNVISLSGVYACDG